MTSMADIAYEDLIDFDIVWGTMFDQTRASNLRNPLALHTGMVVDFTAADRRKVASWEQMGVVLASWGIAHTSDDHWANLGFDIRKAEKYALPKKEVVLQKFRNILFYSHPDHYGAFPDEDLKAITAWTSKLVLAKESCLKDLDDQQFVYQHGGGQRQAVPRWLELSLPFLRYWAASNPSSVVLTQLTNLQKIDLGTINA